jgi:hypothetical protein
MLLHKSHDNHSSLCFLHKRHQTNLKPGQRMTEAAAEPARQPAKAQCNGFRARQLMLAAAATGYNWRAQQTLAYLESLLLKQPQRGQGRAPQHDYKCSLRSSEVTSSEHLCLLALTSVMAETCMIFALTPGQPADDQHNRLRSGHLQMKYHVLLLLPSPYQRSLGCQCAALPSGSARLAQASNALSVS